MKDLPEMSPGPHEIEVHAEVTPDPIHFGKSIVRETVKIEKKVSQEP